MDRVQDQEAFLISGLGIFVYCSAIDWTLKGKWGEDWCPGHCLERPEELSKNYRVENEDSVIQCRHIVGGPEAIQD